MDIENLQFLTEEEKKDYIVRFWEYISPVFEKHILKTKALKTKYNIKSVPPQKKYEVRKRVTLTHKATVERRIVFDLSVRDWLWADASIQLKYDLVQTKNLLIPERKVIRGVKRTHFVWRPTDSKYWFVDSFVPVSQYLKIVELSPLDVGVFDNIESLAKNLFKGVLR